MRCTGRLHFLSRSRVNVTIVARSSAERGRTMTNLSSLPAQFPSCFLQTFTVIRLYTPPRRRPSYSYANGNSHAISSWCVIGSRMCLATYAALPISRSRATRISVHLYARMCVRTGAPVHGGASAYIARALILSPSHVTISADIYVIRVYISYIYIYIYIYMYIHVRIYIICIIYKCTNVLLDIARYWCSAFQTERAIPRPAPRIPYRIPWPPFRSRKLIKVQLIKITYFSSIAVDGAGGGERQRRRLVTGSRTGQGEGNGARGMCDPFFPSLVFFLPFSRRAPRAFPPVLAKGWEKLRRRGLAGFLAYKGGRGRAVEIQANLVIRRMARATTPTIFTGHFTATRFFPSLRCPA